MSTIHEKSLAFAVRCVMLQRLLSSERNEFVLSKQLLRSGTSIGANVREGKNAQSKADFINKMNIALKEADETQYWLEVMKLSNTINENEYTSLNNDVSELIAMLTSIVVSSKKNLQQKDFQEPKI